MTLALRLLLATVCLLSLADLLHAAEQPPTAPPDRLAMVSPHEVKGITDSLVIVACRVDDMTDKRPLPDNVFPARGWKDLELHLNEALEYECRREIIKPQDKEVYNEAATADMPEMRPNFAALGACLRVGVPFASEYYDQNPGWAVVGIGCPSPIDLNGDGAIDTYKLPECPDYLPGTTNRMRCRFDASII
jgi:hypothetical protein